MNRPVVRKLMRAAALSLLVLTTTSGVASLQVLAASPAIADQGSTVSDQAAEETAPAPAPQQPENPVTKLVEDVLGG